MRVIARRSHEEAMRQTRGAVVFLLAVVSALMPIHLSGATSPVPPGAVLRVIPHIYYGGGFQTNITITNLASTTNVVTVNTLSQAGMLVRSALYSIAPGLTVRIPTDANQRYGVPTTQWAMVGAQAPIGINVFYELRAADDQPIVNTVGFNDVIPNTQFTFPVEIEPVGRGLISWVSRFALRESGVDSPAARITQAATTRSDFPPGHANVRSARCWDTTPGL